MIEDVQDYNKLGGMKKELYNTRTRVFTMKEISARQNNAVMTLFRLQNYYGISDDQIFKLCKFFEKYDYTINSKSFGSDLDKYEGFLNELTRTYRNQMIRD